jgi:hypothetical protein
MGLFEISLIDYATGDRISRYRGSATFYAKSLLADFSFIYDSPSSFIPLLTNIGLS